MNTTTEIPLGKTRGQIAYEAYCEATNWKSLANGSALPQWPEVKDKIKEAWEKSAEALVAALPAALPAETAVVAANAAETAAAAAVAESLREVEEVFDLAGVKRETGAGLTFSPAGRAAAVLNDLKAVTVERDEILARFANELGLKEGGFAEVLRAITETKAAALEARTEQAPFAGQGMTIKRTGRLIEVRLAETGEVEQQQLDAVVALLNRAGLGTH